MPEYFSDRVTGPKPLVGDTISQQVWHGLGAYVQKIHADEWFAEAFPARGCSDGDDITGTAERTLVRCMIAENPDLFDYWNANRPEPTPPSHRYTSLSLDDDDVEPDHVHSQAEASPPDSLSAILDLDVVPPTHVLMDLLEFLHRNTSQGESWYHSYMRHNHWHKFNRRGGQESFRLQVNAIFKRNGLAFAFTHDGAIERVVSEPLEALLRMPLRSGDAEVDRFVGQAVANLRGHTPTARDYALRDIWHAWERMKTILPGDKRQAIGALLDRAAPEPRMRDLLEAEARALTEVGNKFMIRHSETDKVKIERSTHQEYLFHRIYALIFLLSASK